VLFVLQSAAWERLDLPGIALTPREVKREETKVDLTFAIHETGGGLTLALQYDRDLFDGTTMARLAAQYEELLSAALAEPERPVSGLPALLPGERHQVFHEWNDTAAAYAPDL
jgi:non-ribosomal peptide synthetase component F